MRRRDACGAHEGAVRDAHAGELRRGGVVQRDVPVRDEVIVEELGQEAATWRKARPAVALRHDVEVLHLQQVAWPRSIYVNRPGQRMGNGALEALEILRRAARADLQVVGIARLEREL